ncbi:leucine-rich repeat-containing protein [Heterostelium album PN500]|uniref:Leucine-rich repeat-containing protein n=1 Tax=Heterostelium pallidum (strain ATCC 26659 / Pp 5 / PN500) TaxID=670386 RepID=D3BUB8_HETP5|nr:leucine-rich repeat-containing protein [Heterostelium album PN500]EFA75052.1 leucine-rich repeat-containing protein [Heterostelium album PN500]|eukprot:XP_020427186.1 leucine-rich repeat-containing protein [Heterostelium album PN500]
MDAVKMIKQSVKRNPKSVTLLQLPIVDINAMLLQDKSTVGQDKLHKQLVETQNIIHANIVHQVTIAEKSSDSLSSSSSSYGSNNATNTSPNRGVNIGGSLTTSNGNISTSSLPVRKMTSPVQPGGGSLSKLPPVSKTGSIESMSAKRPAMRGPLYPGRQTSLTESGGAANKSAATPDIPPIVARSIDYLVAKGTKVVGIFRTCASATLLKKVKARFEAGEDIDLAGEGVDPDTVAGVLKSYFRELAVPIFPDNLHDRFFQASRMSTLEEKIAAYRDVIEQLPALENKMVKKLFNLLYLISLEKAENMMSAENIAICWAPTLFRSFASELLPINAFLMVHYFEIFDPENAPVKAKQSSVPVADSAAASQESISDTQSTGSGVSANNTGDDSSPVSTPPASPKIGDGMSTLRGKRFSRVSRVSYSPVMSRASLGHSTLGWSESSRSLSSLFQDEWDNENNKNSPPSEPQTV